MRGPFARPRDVLRARRELESRTDRSLRPAAAAAAAAAARQQQQRRRQQQQQQDQRRRQRRWLPDSDSTRRGFTVAGVAPADKRPCHAHNRVVASAIMRCGSKIITCHENPVVLLA